MATRCHFCQGLSISRLVDLAQREFLARYFPPTYYYSHQPSYRDLQVSAENGCDICAVIYKGLSKSPFEYGIWEGLCREDLIIEAEEEGRSTDIKIAINAEHLYSSSINDHADSVRLFDLLMVQVGSVEHIPETEDTDEIMPIDPLEFIIYSQLETHYYVDGFAVGRLITDPDLSSPRNFELAHSWLQSCEKHSNCPAIVEPELPTRVLDIGICDDYSDLKLFVTQGLRAHYVCLSHCWGGTISPLLNVANLEAWQKSITFAELPANMQHAIEVTKRLGLQYLWIDALCIVQDSRDDWATESQQMGNRYRNGYFTISAATSEKSTEGFLKHLPPSQEEDNMIDIHIHDDTENSSSVKIAIKPYLRDDESLGKIFRESVLHTRGWCLQETTISPRIFHFGSRNIYFQCCEGFRSADGVPPYFREPDGRAYQNFSRLIHHSRQKDEELPLAQQLDKVQDEYYELVKDFSDRKLTYGSDKFPAFSGLAKLMRPAFGNGEYIAGVWSNDIARGLCWSNEMGHCRHIKNEYRAPSWSWAVTNDPIVWNSPETATSSIRDGKFNVELVGFVREPKNIDDVYGELSCATLTLQGYTKRLVRSSQNVSMRWPKGGCALVSLDEREESVEPGENECLVFEAIDRDGENILVIIRTGNENDQYDWEIDPCLFRKEEYIALVVQADCVDYAGEEAGEGRGLILQKVNGFANAYARVGYVDLQLSDEYQRTPASFEMWMEGWERRLITLV